MNPKGEGFHQEHASRSRRRDRPLGPLGRDPERLLAQDVLAGLGGPHGKIDVHVMRGGDVHDLDRRVRQQLVVTAVGAVGAVLARELVRLRTLAARHGGQPPRCRCADRIREDMRDPAQPQDPPGSAFSHGRLLDVGPVGPGRDSSSLCVPLGIRERRGGENELSPIGLAGDGGDWFRTRSSGRGPGRRPSRRGSGTHGPSGAATAPCQAQRTPTRRCTPGCCWRADSCSQSPTSRL